MAIYHVERVLLLLLLLVRPTINHLSACSSSSSRRQITLSLIFLHVNNTSNIGMNNTLSLNRLLLLANITIIQVESNYDYIKILSIG